MFVGLIFLFIFFPAQPSLVFRKHPVGLKPVSGIYIYINIYIYIFSCFEYGSCVFDQFKDRYCLFVCLSVCLSVCLPPYCPFVCLSACLVSVSFLPHVFWSALGRTGGFCTTSRGAGTTALRPCCPRTCWR